MLAPWSTKTKSKLATVSLQARVAKYNLLFSASVFAKINSVYEMIHEPNNSLRVSIGPGLPSIVFERASGFSKDGRKRKQKRKGNGHQEGYKKKAQF